MRRPRLITQYNYVFLLAALLAVLIGGPLSKEVYHESLPPIIEVLVVLVFLIGVWSLAGRRNLFWVGGILVVLAFLLNLAGVLLDLIVLRYAMLIVLSVFLGLTIAIATRDILTADEVDLNRLTGAAGVYLLIGMIFGSVFFLLNVITPGALNGVKATGFNSGLVEMTYYSFVTLTTVGYGDINPVTPMARTLSFMEAILGQMYLTILVAALVGIHISSRQSRRKSGS